MPLELPLLDRAPHELSEDATCLLLTDKPTDAKVIHSIVSGGAPPIDVSSEKTIETQLPTEKTLKPATPTTIFLSQATDVTKSINATSIAEDTTMQGVSDDVSDTSTDDSKDDSTDDNSDTDAAQLPIVISAANAQGGLTAPITGSSKNTSADAELDHVRILEQSLRADDTEIIGSDNVVHDMEDIQDADDFIITRSRPIIYEVEEHDSNVESYFPAAEAVNLSTPAQYTAALDQLQKDDMLGETTPHVEVEASSDSDDEEIDNSDGSDASSDYNPNVGGRTAGGYIESDDDDNLAGRLDSALYTERLSEKEDPPYEMTDDLSVAELGTVVNRVEYSIIIRGTPSAKDGIPGPGAVLCLENRTYVARITELMGQTRDPLFIVNFTDSERAQQSPLSQSGTKVYYVIKEANYIFATGINRTSTLFEGRYDVADENGEDSDPAYSDDEAEAAAEAGATSLGAARRGGAMNDRSRGRGRGSRHRLSGDRDRGGRGRGRGRGHPVGFTPRQPHFDNLGSVEPAQVSYDDDGYQPLMRPSTYAEDNEAFSSGMGQAPTRARPSSSGQSQPFGFQQYNGGQNNPNRKRGLEPDVNGYRSDRLPPYGGNGSRFEQTPSGSRDSRDERFRGQIGMYRGGDQSRGTGKRGRGGFNNDRGRADGSREGPNRGSQGRERYTSDRGRGDSHRGGLDRGGGGGYTDRGSHRDGRGSFGSNHRGSERGAHQTWVNNGNMGSQTGDLGVYGGQNQYQPVFPPATQYGGFNGYGYQSQAAPQQMAFNHASGYVGGYSNTSFGPAYQALTSSGPATTTVAPLPPAPAQGNIPGLGMTQTATATPTSQYSYGQAPGRFDGR